MNQLNYAGFGSQFKAESNPKQYSSFSAANAAGLDLGYRPEGTISYIGQVKQIVEVKPLLDTLRGNKYVSDSIDVKEKGGSILGAFLELDKVLDKLELTKIGSLFVGLSNPAVAIGMVLFSEAAKKQLEEMGKVCEFLKGELDDGHDVICLVSDCAMVYPLSATQTARMEIYNKYEKHLEYETNETVECTITASAIKYRKKPYTGFNDKNPAWGQKNNGVTVTCDKVAYTSDYKWVSFLDSDNTRYYMPVEEKSSGNSWAKRVIK